MSTTDELQIINKSRQTALTSLSNQVTTMRLHPYVLLVLNVRVKVVDALVTHKLHPHHQQTSDKVKVRKVTL